MLCWQRGIRVLRAMLERAGLCPLRRPVGMSRSGWMSSTVSRFARRRSTVCSMSSVMTGGRPPWLPLRFAVSSPSGVASRMF